MSKSFKICFISRQAYPYLSKENHNSAGGSELQETLLTKELLKRENKVSFIVGDYGQDGYTVIDDLEIYKGFFSYNKGLISKFLEPIYFWRLLSKINADVYYRRTPHNLTFIIGLFCKLKRKKFIFAAGSDTHFQKEGLSNIGLVSRINYRLSSKLSHIFIVQNSFQKEKAKELFGKEAVVIKNLMDIPKEISSKKDNPLVLFVGSILEYKQPEIFIELANTIKDTKFYIIGPCNEKGYYNSLKEKASGIQNLTFCDFLLREKILELYKKDIILVNASKFEGFPNTFLEAWSYGNPVVSLNVDPDEVICKYKLGYHSKSYSKMIEDLTKIIENKNLRKEFGLNGRKYVKDNHSIEKIVDEFEELIQNSFKEPNK